jgi:glycosyltransferase involved in cell wall biosynthesis
VLQVVAGDRWTGAAATVLQLTEALHAAGVVCELAFRPGRGLEERLTGFAWAHPVLPKERGLVSLGRNVASLRKLFDNIDLVHCHLPHDHILTRLALRGLRADAASVPAAPCLVRGVHTPGHVRPHLLNRSLYRGTSGLSVANSALQEQAQRLPALAGVPVRVLPVALEPRFRPGGDRAGARARLGIPPAAFVVGSIGKLVEDRGQDLFLRGVASLPGAWALLVGKGPAVPALRELAARVGLAERLAMPGYVEEGLEDLYAAMDLFVFPAAGSDHAHRAIAEAAGCGLASLAVDVPGVVDLVEPGVTGDLWKPGDWQGLARLLRSWASDRERCRRAGAAAAARAGRDWTSTALAEAALELYRTVLQRRL